MKALLIIDLQNDFFPPNGPLAVPGAEEIITPINKAIDHFDHVFATQDYHPKDHVSFAPTHNKNPQEMVLIDNIEQILWPIHCVQNTFGAQLVQGLKQDKIEKVFQKGVRKEMDSYSAFFENDHKTPTKLEPYLKEHKIDTLYFAGLATDYCVKYSVLDALRLGFTVRVLFDCCRAVNLSPGDEKRALKEMQEQGAVIIDSKNL